jgi:hypothetical protein
VVATSQAALNWPGILCKSGLWSSLEGKVSIDEDADSGVGVNSEEKQRCARRLLVGNASESRCLVSEDLCSCCSKNIHISIMRNPQIDAC